MNEPIWVSVMRMLVGIEEVKGPESNPMILNWVKDMNAPKWYDDDDKPWCALGLNRVLLACQLRMSGTGFELLRAKSFETWGKELRIPALGCIMVFSRPEGAHVGLYLGERRDAYLILGANQGDTIKTSWIAKKRLTAIRWPAEVSLPVGERIWFDVATDEVSENER